MIRAEYVKFDDWHYALVSVVVIDSVINETQYRCDHETYFQWMETLKCFDFSSLKQKKIVAIDEVLPDSLELKGLWEEN